MNFMFLEKMFAHREYAPNLHTFQKSTKSSKVYTKSVDGL